MAKMSVLEKIIVNSKLDYLFHRYFGISKILDNVEIGSDSHVLEVGAGVGITTDFIADKFPTAQITATDYDESQVEYATVNNTHTNVRFQIEDATKLSFADESYDVVFAILVFHHIKNFPKALAEIYRVLKPGGLFYIYDIPAKGWNPLFRWFRLGTPGVFSKNEFIDILKSKSFKIINVRSKLRFVITCQK